MDKFKLRNYLYYIIIGFLSIIVLVFLPMIGSKANIHFAWPNTTLGWCIYIGVKVITAVLNILIFHCFMQQAKINISKDTKYQEANNILGRLKFKETRPKGPSEWTSKQYLNKGTTIFITSALGTIVLTDALLQFDYMVMLTYLFVLSMGIIFGILQMKSAECYWTNEYYEYAKMKESEEKNETQELLDLYNIVIHKKPIQNLKLSKEGGIILKCLYMMEKNIEI